MKIAELKNKSKAELTKLLAEQREKLRQLRFDLTGGKVKNVRELRNTKRLIAQILTICQNDNS